MHLAGMSLDELSFPEDMSHELNKDAMLEKIILVCTSYFALEQNIDSSQFPLMQRLKRSFQEQNQTCGMLKVFTSQRHFYQEIVL